MRKTLYMYPPKDHWLYLLFVLCLITSCAPEVSYTDNKDLPVLSPVEQVNFPLGNTSEVFPKDLHYHQQSNTLTFFDHLKSELVIIDFATKEQETVIPFSTEGPDGIGRHSNIGHYYQSPDSIYIFNKFRNELILFDANQKAIERLKIRPDDAPMTVPFPDARTLRPLIIHDNLAILMGVSIGLEPQEDHTLVNNLFFYDLETHELDYALPRPDIYNQGQWGALIKYFGFFNYIPKEEKLICSLGLDHNVYLFDLKTQQHSVHHAPISIFPKTFIPLREDINADIPKEKMRQYSHTTPTYYAILHDPYKEVYYRFGTPPQTDEEYLSNEPLGLIMAVFDKDFTNLGEYQFPPNYPLKYHAIFVAPDGLYINAVPSEENQISFYRFEVNL